MMTDPRKACGNTEQLLLWAFVHDLIAHPFMAITFWSKPALKFHDWTSNKAWPRKDEFIGEQDYSFVFRKARIVASNIAPGVWSVAHPSVSHCLVITADDKFTAIRKGLEWFVHLSQELQGEFTL